MRKEAFFRFVNKIAWKRMIFFSSILNISLCVHKICVDSAGLYDSHRKQQDN